MSQKQFTIHDTNKMSWQEFDQLIDNLLQKIKATNVSFDAIIPILRNGAIPATIIANKLDIITYLPLQVKYNYSAKEIEQLIPFYKPITKDLGERPHFLVVESNTFSGQSAIKAAEIIKKEYPNAYLYYATVTRVYRNPEIQLPMYEQYFYGCQTNENFEADNNTEKSLYLRPNITIYPWESVENELHDINSFFDN